MLSKSVVSPEDQRVTFVELFFDLVFVFSVTQVVSILHHELTWATIGQAVLVFWLVWWGWTQFTWALNAADTTHPLVEIGTLAASAVAFFMVVALPDAFHGGALPFALTYVLVRGVGLALYLWVASNDPRQGAVVRRFALVSIAGLVTALLGGVAGGMLQYVFWGAAFLLDVVAATLGASRDGWNIHPDHFSERHGLFVIIALGETLIAAASVTIGMVWTGHVIAVAILSVAITCALWWIYFTQAKPLLDHALEHARDSVRSAMARDVYSLLHFPMLCGLIAYTVGIEAAVAHPSEPLELNAKIALAVGICLFAVSIGAQTWRATRHISVPRLGATLVTMVLAVLVSDVPAAVSLTIVFVGTVTVILLERRPAPEAIAAEAAQI